MSKPESCRPPKRWLAVVVAVAAVAAFVVAAAGYQWLAPGASRIVEAEPAGSATGIRHVIGGNQGAYLRALWADFVFIVGYGVALASGAWLALRLSFTSTTRRLARAALVATLVAVVSDVFENVLLRLSGGADGAGYAVAVQAFAFTQWSLVPPAAVVAIVGICTTLWRATRRGTAPRLPVISPSVDEDAPLARGEAGDLAVSCAAWRAHSKVPDHDPAPDRATEIGICVSGGGIRSATFAFGALDAMRTVLTRARWLVAVSGGGYAAGAMQLTLQRLHDHSEGISVARPADVYRPGSSELDYTRLHGRYLADGTREWIVAAVTVLRGFLVNMLTLGLIVVTFGRLLAHGYAWMPFDPRMLKATSWGPQPGVLWAVGVLAGGWLLLSTVAVFAKPGHRWRTTGLRRIGDWALGVAGVVALAGAGLPALAWAVLRMPPPSLRDPSVSLVAGYLAALIALFKQPSMRAVMGRKIGRGRAWFRTVGAGGRNLMATVGVYLGLLALLGGFVMLFGVALAHTGGALTRSDWPGHLPEWVWTVVLVGVLGLLSRMDQVRWSLHPFYRRRLASAFAVRRVRDGGRVQAKPYDFDAETTDLATHGARPEGFPEVIFCCAAHVSGKDAPPGRRVVPWTMSARYVGGQRHGWVSTDALRSCAGVSPTLHADLTVQAAQAISGAAVASQMGVQQRAYTKFLTLTNIRLGSWLPNPAHLRSETSWARPRLPRKRGLTTLARELAGVFSLDGPLVYVTDGGHFENLGLVELLRRRPAVVYCVDASCDHGGVPQTLAAAIELAREELGVDITFDTAADLGAGPDQPPPVAPADQLMAQMMDRLAPTSVITGTITYPDLDHPYRSATAKIVVGKAALTAVTPFALLAYGSDHPSFPDDKTSDQWFDASQFDAYHSLGRHVGKIMLARLPLPLSGEDSPLGPPDIPESMATTS